MQQLNSLLFAIIFIAVSSPLLSQLQPVTLPYYENFESASGVFYVDSTCVYCDSLVQFDFKTPSDGELTFESQYSNHTFGASDSVSATLHPHNNTFGATAVSRLHVTLNMSNYDTADATTVLLSFYHYDHLDEDHDKDIVYVRGSKSDNWIIAYNLADNSVDNFWIKADRLNISNLLRQNGQNFSNEFQVNFGEEDDNRDLSIDGRSIDDILLEQVSCVLPRALSANVTSDTSVSVSWASLPNQTMAELWIAEKDALLTNPKSGSKFVISSSNVAELDTLKPNTCYVYTARHICGVGDTSIWADPITLWTNCAPIQAPYFEDFDGLDTGLTGIFGNCWFTTEPNTELQWTRYNKLKTGKSFGYITPKGLITDAGRGYGNYMWASYDGAYKADTSILQMNAPVNISNLTSPEVRFSYHLLGAANGNSLVLEIDTGNGWKRELAISGSQQSSSSDKWIDTAYSLIGYPNQLKIRFFTRRYHLAQHVALDNIAIDNQISCTSPVALSLDAISTNSATIMIDSSGIGNTFEVSYGIGIQNPDLGAKYVFNGNILSLIGLSAANNYCVYIRQICGVSDTSHWSEPFCFNTECPPMMAPYGDSFNSYYGSKIPLCWLSKEPAKDSTVMLVEKTDGGISAPSAPYSLEINNGSFPTMAIGPIFQDLGTGLNRIRFKMAYEAGSNTYTKDTLIIGTVNASGAPLSFKKYDKLQASPDLQFHEYIIELTDTNRIDSNKRVAFMYGPKYQAGFEYYIDDFYYEPISACGRPSGLMVSDSSCTAFELSWNSNGVASFVEYGSRGFHRGFGNYSGLINSPYVMDSIFSSSKYDIYVYNVCQGDTSVFHGPVVAGSDKDAKPKAYFTVVSDSANNGKRYLTFDASQSFEGWTYEWDFGNGIFISQNQSPSSSTTYSQNGPVTITLVVKNRCFNTDTFSLNYDVYIGQNEYELTRNEVDVFPNPTSGIINISVPEKAIGSSTLGVTNIHGQVIIREEVIEKALTSIELPDSKGVYYISIRLTDGQVLSWKVVRE